MEKYNIKVRIVYNGKYYLINGDKIGENISDKKIKQHIRDKVKTNTIMNKFVLKKFGMNSEFNNNLCGSCQKMTMCPKVRDIEKRDLKCYPYIRSGIEVVLINSEKKEKYEEALKTYNDLNEKIDFDIEDYPELKESLSDNGVDVPLISVFGCSNYVDDGCKEIYESRTGKFKNGGRHAKNKRL